MNQPYFANQKILLFPCAGESDVGQLTLHASQELVLEGKGEWVGLSQITDLQEMSRRTTDFPPFIVVDGCDQQCVRKRLEALNYDLEFHLSLADLGIEKTDSIEIICDYLQLVKDAIVAECTRLSERSPVILGGCGCR